MFSNTQQNQKHGIYFTSGCSMVSGTLTGQKVSIIKIQIHHFKIVNPNPDTRNILLSQYGRIFLLFSLRRHLF